jgi:hypothetical protein
MRKLSVDQPCGRLKVGRAFGSQSERPPTGRANPFSKLEDTADEMMRIETSGHIALLTLV